MANTTRECCHVLANGEVCRAVPMRDSNFCYWHHKARARNRRNDSIGGPISREANTGVQLPLLEDANSIQIAIQEVMQAILDRRIDNKRASLLLYSLQLASSNVRNVHTLPSEFASHIVRIGKRDQDAIDDIDDDDDETDETDDEVSDDGEAEDQESDDDAENTDTAPQPEPVSLDAGNATPALPLPKKPSVSVDIAEHQVDQEFIQTATPG